MSKDILDIEELLERVQDDKELMLELFDIYLEDYVGKRVALEQACKSSNFEEIKSIGHSLKGASGNISAKSVREICMTFEDMGKNELLTGWENLIADLDKQIELLKEQIAQVKAQNS